MQFSTKASVDVGMGIGIAVARKDGEAPDELLRQADYAPYLHRGEGRGSFAFFVLGNEGKSLIWVLANRCGDGAVSAAV
jgi:predicted signal transduction protein with EAL and GGDEF domain